MYQEADKFYQEMGLLPMTPKFWQNSIVVKPTDGRDMLCHATAFEFCEHVPRGENADYRIKMCTEVNQEQFGVLHHEMGENMGAFVVRVCGPNQSILFSRSCRILHALRPPTIRFP